MTYGCDATASRPARHAHFETVSRTNLRLWKKYSFFAHLYSTRSLSGTYNNSFMLKTTNLSILLVACHTRPTRYAYGTSGHRTDLGLWIKDSIFAHLYSSKSFPGMYNESFMLKMPNLSILLVKIYTKIRAWLVRDLADRVGFQKFLRLLFDL